jgi:SAM-dependent methyltransferase
MAEMDGYYRERLSAGLLERAYEIAPPRVRRYLDAEIEHVLTFIEPGDAVLELGCGYGRVLERLVSRCGRLVGIDTSTTSLRRAAERRTDRTGCRLVAMDASRLALRDASFDVVVCVQNGISAFHVDRRTLVGEAIRVARPGGAVLFSSYSGAFWKDRLAWFELQAAEGLVGTIDRARTRDGVIVCDDGFTAATVTAGEFDAIAAALGVRARIVEVDSSSLFCEITAGESAAPPEG